jgi:hypothetical protein
MLGETIELLLPRWVIMLIHQSPHKQKERGWAGIHQVFVTV